MAESDPRNQDSPAFDAVPGLAAQVPDPKDVSAPYSPPVIKEPPTPETTAPAAPEGAADAPAFDAVPGLAAEAPASKTAVDKTEERKNG